MTKRRRQPSHLRAWRCVINHDDSIEMKRSNVTYNTGRFTGKLRSDFPLVLVKGSKVRNMW